jgi:hypothetical protein
MDLSRVRKQVYELSIADLVRSPAWEFALDEEDVDGQDEATVRPYRSNGDLDPEGGGQFVVLASFVLADGSRMQGYLTPSPDGADLGSIHPCIVTSLGQVAFWCGRIEPTSEQLAADYARLGKITSAQVFPIQFRSEVPLLSGPIAGKIPGFLVLGDNFQSVRTIT